MSSLVFVTAACGNRRDVEGERAGETFTVDLGAEVGMGKVSADAAIRDDGSAEDAISRPQPDRAYVLAKRADERASGGDLAGALSLYGQAVKLDPDSPWHRIARGWFNSRSGRMELARDDVEKGLDLVDRSDPLLLAAAHLALGEIREKRRDLARARESYRTALRAWSSQPVARALLRLTPQTSDQRAAAERIAFGETSQSASVLKVFSGTGLTGYAEPLAVGAIPDFGETVVVALPRPRDSSLPAGAEYHLRLPNDRGVSIKLGEATVLRWHQAKMEVVELGHKRRGLLVTIETTAPGSGAPLSVSSALISFNGEEPSLLFSHETGAERDEPLGCRRGWREKLVLSDTSGDGLIDSLKVTKNEFVRPRLQKTSGCEKSIRAVGMETIPLTKGS